MNDAPKGYNTFAAGDFYTTDSDNFQTFWGNNAGEYGVQRIDWDGPLLDAPIPKDNYNRFGVKALVGATYVSRARDPDVKYYIVFRVKSIGTMTVLDWVMVYRP